MARASLLPRGYADLCVANGLVTRCPDPVRYNLNPRRGSGVMPSHLRDPRYHASEDVS